MARALTNIVSTELKNYIINSNFEFWQRGATYVDLGDRYTADRFFRFKQTGGGAGVSASRQSISDLPGSQFAYRAQRTSGSASTLQSEVVYAAETKDSVPLQGKVCTFSFWARRGANFSGASNQMHVTLTYGSGIDQGVLNLFTGQVGIDTLITLTTTWTRYTITYPAFPTNMTQWRFEFSWFPTGTAGAADYFEMAQLMFAPGDGPANYQTAGRTFQGELAMCHRYFEKSYAMATDPETVATTGSHVWHGQNVANRPFTTVVFRVTKRVSPSVVLYNPITLATSTPIRDTNAPADYVANVNSGAERSFTINPTGTPPADAVLQTQWTASAEL